MSAQTYASPVLAELQTRAGASDQDREAWLAERRSGITATEVRDLYLGRITRQDLIDLKLGRREDTFVGNRFTAWGTDREPVIAAAFAGEGFAPESRVFHHPDNRRHLASPDGIRITFDEVIEIAEYKTSGYDLPPGSDALERKGYRIQVAWLLYVIVAARCRFGVEERIELPDRSFEAGSLHRHWLERDDDLIAELVVLADGFLAELDRQRDEGAPDIDEVVDTHAVNYLRGLSAEKEGAELKKSAYAALVAAGVSQTSALARVTFSPAKPGQTVVVEEIDYTAARATEEGAALHAAFQEAQDAWASYCEEFKTEREETGKGTPAKVTVTAVKERERG